MVNPNLVKKVLVHVIFWQLLVLSFGAQARVALPDFTQIVKDSSAAVVNISTTQKLKSKRNRLPPGTEIPDFGPDSPFNDFFRRFFDEDGEIEEYDSQSLGSGFIISKDGYVITNNHVIRNADEVIVRLSDRREFSAKIIGGDDRSDVAVLKIEAENLPTVTMGKNKKLNVGEWVLAIGSPFGFEHTVTAGIVSAIGRSLPRENYVPFIQTDVAINPGNSGGPLFNLDGEVIGVNSQIFSRTGGFMGLSFAIPIDVAVDVASQLRTKGKVSRGWLGVLIQDVTQELAESFGMDKPEGALVAKILEDSPAKNADLRVGDVILKFNGKLVSRSSDLPPLVGAEPVGSTVSMGILREGKEKVVKVKLSELPEENKLSLSSSNGDTSNSRLGLTVKDLTDKNREQLEVESGGVLVTKVNEGPAKKAGIRRGDVILKLNNLDIKNAKQFKEIAKDVPAGRSVSIYVLRGGNPLFLAIKID